MLPPKPLLKVFQRQIWNFEYSIEYKLGSCYRDAIFITAKIFLLAAPDEVKPISIELQVGGMRFACYQSVGGKDQISSRFDKGGQFR